MTSAQIRKQFIDFFVQKHGHTFVPSSPVVPVDDPTLLFTNAGMNQFKPIFLGTERRPYTRAANTQKCIRAGGKHNDLDDVGRSRRHHTFFEMLGNWSFGDYFKQGAIEMAWELLTKVWKLDPTRLHVSCYQGDEAHGVPRDTEAANIWKQVAGLPDDHIHYFGKDNFWEMGETGPCGPCTEIYVDRRPQSEVDADRAAGRRAPVNGEDPRVMEIWNLVFIQYNRNPDRTLTVLPSQHVDTGMGFERITQVLQDVDSNYSIDLWDPFWAKLKELSGHTYSGKFTKTNSVDAVAEAADEGLRKDIAFRVIADHARCLTFALTDGAVPSNEGRGYVLRRILRRAVRFGRQQLGLREPFLHTLVPIVVDSMGEAFPELRKNPKHVTELVKDEEVSFGKTLDRGIKLFEEAAIRAIISAIESAEGTEFVAQKANVVGGTTSGKDSGFRLVFRGLNRSEWEFDPVYGLSDILNELNVRPPEISGSDAFKLHDTYGFPIDLTRIMAEERGMTVDLAGYEKLMDDAKKISGGGPGGESRLFELPPDVLAELHKTGVAPTDDSYKFNAAPIGATVKAIWDGHRLIPHTHGAEAAAAGVAVVLDRTCFYAEMGGQVGDTGELRSPGGAVMAVETTRSAGGYVLHVGHMEEGHFSVGDHVTGTLAGVRPRTERNHTATHLANWALREVLGEGVQQKGSLVDPDKLRFDFSHGQSLAEAELARVEELVNQDIARKLPVYAQEAPQEQALKINGLRAVFGEKYPPMVRVVSIGVPVADLLKDPANSKWRQFSVEFCGGTHLKNAADAGGFVITAEESVSKGIRRIVALTGDAAREVVSRGESVETQLESAKGKPDAELPTVIAELHKSIGAGDLSLRTRRRAQATIAELQDRYKKWEKTNRAQSAAKIDVAEISAKLLSDAPALGPGKLVVGEVAGATPEQLLSVTDSLKKKAGSYAVLLGSAVDAKVSFVAAVSDDLIAQGLKAGDWIREAAKATGGGGGGRPQLAQAGGKDPAKLPDALKVASDFAMKTVR
ncbi:MAG TPA: alanine--tRNA ligase [Tepidisphaeraceae bacterium]|jgi:alanyl-tRNA synthetase